ncbi:MAG: type II toxin-antitoxin system RelE/ParE family toxin [Firmicutes bacterium]|nr:type II toxin-antitoxin system RelE/ParE family toxin [Bacillota bacterium]
MKDVITTTSADKDITRIYLNIYRDSPKNALKQAEQIDRHFENIGHFPGICLPLTNKVDIETDLKYSISVPYIIISRHYAKHIEVYRVFHCKENYISKLFEV